MYSQFLSLSFILCTSFLKLSLNLSVLSHYFELFIKYIACLISFSFVVVLWGFILFFHLKHIFKSPHFGCLCVCFHELGKTATTAGLKGMALYRSILCVDCVSWVLWQVSWSWSWSWRRHRPWRVPGVCQARTSPGQLML